MARRWGGGYCCLDDSYSNSVWCRWFRRELILQQNLCFDESMKYGEDTLFLAKFRPVCKTAIIYAVPLYFYFQREDSAMHKIDIEEHSRCLLKMALVYHNMSQNLEKYDDDVRKRMDNAYIRAMQAFCTDVCLYSANFFDVKQILTRLKKNTLYPFGIDFGNFKIDKRQSIKNDLLNWFFGLLSIEPYFWICFTICRIIFKRREKKKFNLQIYDDVLIE